MYKNKTLRVSLHAYQKGRDSIAIIFFIIQQSNTADTAYQIS